MRKRLAILVLAVLMTFPVLAGTAHAADRVRCDFRGNYRVVCYNNTPYRVHLRLKLFTNCGVRYRYFTILNYSHSVSSPCYINRITWRWDF